MRFELEFLLYTAVAPFVTAVVVAFLLGRASRQTLAIAAAAGCVVGYVLLPEWAPLVPQRHWQWILYLTPVAALVGSLAAGRSAVLGAALYVALGFVVAWRSFPTWDTLQPSRMLLIPALAVYLGLLSTLLSALPERLRGKAFGVILTCTAASVALLVGAEVSLMLGHAAAVAAAALAGCCAWSMLASRDGGFAIAWQGAVPVFTTAAVGFAFVGAVEPSQPVWILLAAPAAPLVLFVFTRGPLSRLEGVTAAVAQIVLVALVPLAIGGWLILRAPAADDWSASSAISGAACSEYRARVS